MSTLPGPGGLRSRNRSASFSLVTQLGRSAMTQPSRTLSPMRGYIPGPRRSWYRAPHHLTSAQPAQRYITQRFIAARSIIEAQVHHRTIAHEPHRPTKHSVPSHYRPAAPHHRKHLPHDVFPGDLVVLCPAAALLPARTAGSDSPFAAAPLGLVWLQLVFDLQPPPSLHSSPISHSVAGARPTRLRGL